MKTIEERAREFACLGCDGNKNGMCSEGYHPNKCPHSSSKYQNHIAGAIEQRKIDIEKVCKHLERLGVFDWLAGGFGVSAEVVKDQFVLTIMEG